MWSLALVAGSACAAYWASGRPRREVPSRAETMRVLGEVVRRAPHTRFELEPPTTDEALEPTVRLIEHRPIQPLPPDAAPPARRARAQSRSMSPAAIAARRARAEQRAGTHDRPPALRCPAPALRAVVVDATVIDATEAGSEAPQERDPAAVARPHRRRRAALGSLRVSPRLAAGAAAVILAVVGLLVSRPATHAARPALATRPQQAAPATAVTTPPPTIPALAAPPVRAVVPVQGTHATVDTPTTFDLRLDATARCWVRVTGGDTGGVLLEETLQPGDQRTVHASAPVHLRAGAIQGLTITVNGRAVVLDGAPSGPLDVDFRPTSA